MIPYSPILNEIDYKGYHIGILRLDLIHPEISGNKWFKLKYNLQQAIHEKKGTIITFGGAFSNHIAATAVACKQAGLRSIGFIRGEETSIYNSTLSLAKEHGMEFLFMTREAYQQKETSLFLKSLRQQYPNAYIIPEGGSNELGEKGCQEILTPLFNNYDTIFCAYGTGTTFKGVAQSLLPNQTLLGIHVLKYDVTTHLTNAFILNEYHFGGYAKHTTKLLDFKGWFEKNYNIELDYVYTSKLFFATFDLINQEKLEKHKPILIIHSGGLQGNKGYERRYNLNSISH